MNYRHFDKRSVHGRHARDGRTYALGHSQGEFKRLEMQAGLIRDLTADVLRRAGIGSGMRVLDIGCGVGDVSLLAADMVGPSGFVLGIDRSADAIAVAERRAVAAGKCYWTRFAATEIDEFSAHETFDAVIGRLILMYLPDPAATLKRLSSHLRPGGVVAFQEMAMTAAGSVPEGPQFRKCRSWIVETFERAGFETDMGGKLFAAFLDAGLPAPEMIAASHAGGGPDTPAYGYIAETMRSLLPVAERFGVVTAAEADVDTLAASCARKLSGKKHASCFRRSWALGPVRLHINVPSSNVTGFLPSEIVMQERRGSFAVN